MEDSPSRGLSAATSIGFDAETRKLQFATAQTSYNWDCCGVTLEYRRYAIANVRNENLFRFTFSLANIGSVRQSATSRTPVLTPQAATIEDAEPEGKLAAKASQLQAILRQSGRLLVAYSGGIDSAYLAWAAHRELGNDMLAVIADSPVSPAPS